jgi:hypothetical protein
MFDIEINIEMPRVLLLETEIDIQGLLYLDIPVPVGQSHCASTNVLHRRGAFNIEWHECIRLVCSSFTKVRDLKGHDYYHRLKQGNLS